MEPQKQEYLKKIKDLISGPGPGIKIQYDADCSNLTSARAGGKCVALIEVSDEEALSFMLENLQKNNMAFCIIGDGTNLLFNDGPLDICLIKLTGEFEKISYIGNGQVFAGSGCNLQKLVVFSARYGLDLSFLAGIPGTVGGAFAGNCGTADKGICDCTQELRFLAFSGNSVKQIKKFLEKSDFGYRLLRISEIAAITGILLAPEKAGRDEIFLKIRQRIKSKKNSQPVDKHSSGCFFKNPSGAEKSAGEMIDLCGLKGFSFGGAQISKKHANFIINSGSASARDIFVLSRIAAIAVMDKYNIELENEVRLVGF